ncbi:PEP/pyruvate-binding domain-containing protein [Alicyclobacillus fodiniaquatilis]|uniref:PEP/pyruvate-binding domain-containing protein n=1 Tax=Alicyclobacillus fodiniaquatilis TaxID=1661150 RepID=A0ABW4JEZ7_9BACL
MIQKKNIHSDSHHYAEKKKICRLQDEQCLVIDEAGGKAVNLAKLRRAGFPVPDGAVVTTTAFAEYMLDIPAGDSAVIRGAIMERPLDERLQQELREAITPFGDVPFAVRSSGVAEDLADASFAGQYDTLLGVHGFDAVESAVRTCFASAFSRHILQYRTVKQAMAGRMAVLIQPIIEADAAGVAFTANPVTGDRKEVLVSAVKGLGERLVSGQATPDEWTVRGQQAVPIQLPERAMEADDILRVAHLARKAALHFGQPQDIEWAISRGELYLLQARPITTLPRDNAGAKRQIPLPVEVPEGFWEREVSHYPDVLAPATRSTFIVAMNHAMRNLCTEMSLMIETLEQKEIGGWLYQRVVPLGGKERKAPPAWLMPILIRLVPQIKSRLAGAVAWVREDRAGKLLRDWEVRLKPELTRKASNLALVQLDDFSDDQLAAYLSESFEFLKYCLDQHMLLNGAIEYMIARFVFECRALLDWDEAQSMQAFGGLSEISSAPGRAIEAMANFVQSHPALLHDLQEGCSLRDLEASHPKFAEKVAAYVREFGLRALRAELNYPTVGESSHILLQLLKDQLSGNTGQVAEHASILAQQRQRRLAETEQRLLGRTEVERARFSLLLDNAKRAYPLREEHGFYDRDVPVGLLRYGFLEAGKRFVARGHLDCIDDVFEFLGGRCHLGTGADFRDRAEWQSATRRVSHRRDIGIYWGIHGQGTSHSRRIGVLENSARRCIGLSHHFSRVVDGFSQHWGIGDGFGRHSLALRDYRT